MLHRYRGVSAGELLWWLLCKEGGASGFLTIDRVRFTDLFLSSHWSKSMALSDKPRATLRVFWSSHRDWSIEALSVDILPSSLICPRLLSTYLSLRSHWYRELRPFVPSAFPTMAARKRGCV